MVIDNNTHLAVIRSVADILDDYRSNCSPTDMDTIADAMVAAALSFKKAIKSRDFDKAAGIADRLDTMAGKAASLAKYQAMNA